MPRWAHAFLLPTILGAVPIGAAAQAGPFARHGVALTDIYGSSRPMTVTAPDGRQRAIARFSSGRIDDSHARLNVFIGGDDHEVAGGPKAQLLWAPDSRAIAVTADASEAGGGFELSILVRKPKGHHWRPIDLTKRIVRQFAPAMRCDVDEVPDVGAVGWTSGQRLIVAAQVPPHSSCRDRGHVAAYIVDAKSGDVLMELDQRTLRARYRRMLGTVFSTHTRHRKHRER